MKSRSFPVTPAVFTIFNRLLKEIQYLIWEYAVSEVSQGRFVHLYESKVGEGLESWAWRSTCRMPALWFVNNKEALRAADVQSVGVTYNKGRLVKSLLFIGMVDTVFLDTYTINPNRTRPNTYAVRQRCFCQRDLDVFEKFAFSLDYFLLYDVGTFNNMELWLVDLHLCLLRLRELTLLTLPIGTDSTRPPTSTFRSSGSRP